MSVRRFVISLAILFALGTFGFFGYVFFFEVQENIYTGPNEYKYISDMLGGQTSGTSYFGGLMLMCLGEFLLLLALFMPSKNLDADAKTILLGFPVILAAVYTGYEFVQSFFKPYQDNHVLDSILGWLAAGTILIFLVPLLRREN